MRSGPASDLECDPAALKAKYLAERDKRLRSDANEQYVEIKGGFAHYLEDPYVEPGFSRAPLSHEVKSEDAWVDTVTRSAVIGRRFEEECTPGYYNNEGKPSELAARNGPFGAGPIAFVKLLEDWRASNDLPGLEVQ